MSRKIVANYFVSLDGVVESPDKWHFPYFDEAMGEVVGAGFERSDAILMGGTLYREWAACWPTSTDQPIADLMNSQRIVVGDGAKLFPDGSATRPLRLASSRTLPTGVLHLVYTPADAAQ